MVVDWGSSGELRKWIDLLNYVKAKFSWFIFSLNMAHQRKNTKHKWNILGLIKGKDRSDICWDGKEQGFPRGSAGKESTWNAGDPGSIPGLGRSPGEGHGNPLSIPAWRIPWTEELRSIELDTTKATEHEQGFSPDLSSIIVIYFINHSRNYVELLKYLLGWCSMLTMN